MMLFLLCMFMACKKELSVENGGFGGTAQGELVDSLGNCKAATIVGNYSVDTPLTTTGNYVIISVNFTAQGKYKIYSDTVNGMWFLDSGFAVSTGTNTIKLKGYGTPILPKASDFTTYFNNNICGFTITANGSGSTTGGGGSGGTTGTGTNGDYFPTTSGSSWVYRYIPKLGSLDTFTVSAAVGLVTVDTLSYAQFATRLKDTFYFAKDPTRGIYYALSTVDFDYTSVFDTVPSFFITYPFLKENANVTDTWSSPNYGPVWTNGTRGTAKAVFTMISKNTTPYTIGGKTYQNVINIKRDIMFEPDGSSTFTIMLSGNSYYAKNYGLIDQVFAITPSQSVSLDSTPIIK